MAPSTWRTRMIRAYAQRRGPDMFFRALFQTPPENVFPGEQVTFDVRRTGEKIASVINPCNGHNINSLDVFTNKLFTPPTLAEAAAFDCSRLMHRSFGETEYDSTDIGFQAELAGQILTELVLLEDMIKRNMELQCSQIMQTGTLTLKNAAGVDAYVIDFKPKAAHFPAAGVAWTGGAGTPLADINAVAKLIRTNGQLNPDMLIMGDATLEAFLANTDVQTRLDSRRMLLANIDPRLLDSGATLYGEIQIGAYSYQIWTYASEGEIPGASVNTPFLDDESCIVMASRGRKDMVFAGIPQPVNVDPRFASFLPGRITVPQAADILPNIWTTPDGTQTMIGAQSRPLAIPTAIDTFGRIDTGV